MPDRVSREIGGKAEGASHKALRLGQRDGGPPRIGERMRGVDQISPSGFQDNVFPQALVRTLPDPCTGDLG